MKHTKITPYIMAMLLILGVAQASTCAIISPASSAVIKGNTLFNVSASDDLVGLCNITLTSSLTSDSLAIVGNAAGNLINATGGNWLNSTNSTTGTIDASDYIATATCSNTTERFSCNATTTSIIIDNTVPVVSVTTPADENTISTDSGRRSISFSYTCTNATSATLYINNAAHTMTESSDVCTYTKDFLQDQTYNLYVAASDGRNTTNSAITQLYIQTPGGNMGTDTTDDSGNGDLRNLFLVAIVAYLVFGIGKGKKGKK